MKATFMHGGETQEKRRADFLLEVSYAVVATVAALALVVFVHSIPKAPVSHSDMPPVCFSNICFA